MPRDVKSLAGVIKLMTGNPALEFSLLSFRRAVIWVTSILLLLLLSTLIFTKNFNKGSPYEYYVTLSKQNERTNTAKVHQK